MEQLLHFLSLALALTAAAEALSLNRFTGQSHTWLYLSLGFVLISVERLVEVLSGQTHDLGYSVHELVSDALMTAMSALFLFGIHGMRKVFLKHQAIEAALRHELEDLHRFERLTVGRELRMKGLAAENKELHQQIDSLHAGDRR